MPRYMKEYGRNKPISPERPNLTQFQGTAFTCNLCCNPWLVHNSTFWLVLCVNTHTHTQHLQLRYASVFHPSQLFIDIVCFHATYKYHFFLFTATTNHHTLHLLSNFCFMAIRFENLIFNETVHLETFYSSVYFSGDKDMLVK